MLGFRPHHFLCTLGFEGKGYSPEFVRSFQAIADRLRQDPDGDSVMIEVSEATDSICEPCPNRLGTKCTSEDKIQRLDRNHAAVLGLKSGDRLSWGEAKRLLAEKMTAEAFDRACEPCGWKPLGMCKVALMKLKNELSIPALLLFSALLSAHALTSGAPTAEARVKKISHARRSPAGKKPSSSSGASSVASSGSSGKKSSTGSDSASAVTAAKAETESSEPRPIDALREDLYKSQKSKKAKAVAQAMDALRAKKYSQARSLVQSLQGDELFGDYGQALTAASWRAEAMEENEKKRFADAQKNGERALNLYLQIEQRYPASSFIRKLSEELGRTEAVIAEAYHGRKQWKKAQEFYERTFQRMSYSNGLLGMVRPESLGRYAESCARQSGKKKILSESCSAWVNRFAILHPKGSEELKAMVKFIPDADEKSTPPRIENRLTQTYKAPDFDIQAFDQAMEKYNDGKYGDAADAFQKFLDEFPKSAHRFRARYWLGQSLTQRQDHDKAEKVYEELITESPLSYYGMLASMASGKSLDPHIGATLPLASRSDPFLYPAEALKLRRAERFIAEGARELAVQDLRELRARDSLSNPFLMYLALLNSEAGNHNNSFIILSELIQRGYEGVLSSYGLKLIFPVEYMDLIQKQAERNKLDPILVLSLIKQESAFDNQALSSSGASGLMQLMPGTAVDTESSVKRADLIEAETNVRVGVKYLRKLLNRYNGNIAMALAGYNAGPAAVDRWVKDGKSKKGMLEFIEAIPYRETREYVAGIIRNHFWYTRSLSPEPPKPLSYFWSTTPPPTNEQPVELPSPNPLKEARRKTAHPKSKKRQTL